MWYKHPLVLTAAVLVGTGLVLRKLNKHRSFAGGSSFLPPETGSDDDDLLVEEPIRPAFVKPVPLTAPTKATTSEPFMPSALQANEEQVKALMAAYWDVYDTVATKVRKNKQWNAKTVSRLCSIADKIVKDPKQAQETGAVFCESFCRKMGMFGMCRENGCECIPYGGPTKSSQIKERYEALLRQRQELDAQLQQMQVAMAAPKKGKGKSTVEEDIAADLMK